MSFYYISVRSTTSFYKVNKNYNQLVPVVGEQIYMKKV